MKPTRRLRSLRVIPRLIAMPALLLLLGAFPAGGVAQVAPGAGTTGTPGDTLRVLDSIPVLLEPLVVGVERNRSAPPPVASITVSPARLRSTRADNPYDLVRRVAGVEVHDQGQGPGFASNVVMRGFTSDHSADVLLVVDGVPVNLPIHGHVEGLADWNVLLPAAVASMRVIHGAASPLYGDFALAGVTEVFTRADAQGTESVLGLTHRGDLEGSVLTGLRRENGGALVAGELRRQQGWRDNSDYTLLNLLLRGWRGVGEGRLEGGLSLYGTGWSSPGFVDVSRFNRQELTRAIDETDGGDSRRAVAHARFSHPLGADGALQVTGWGMTSDYDIFLHIPGHDHSGTGGTVNQSWEADRRTGGGGQVEFGQVLPRGDLTLGFGGRGDEAEYSHNATLFRDVVDRELDLSATHRSAWLYGRYRREFGGRLGIDLGARLDHLAHTSSSHLDARPDVEATNTVASPKLGLRFALDRGVVLKGSSARGFRSPVGIVGDPTREPYLAWSHEVGAEWNGPGRGANLALFRTDVANERLLDPVTLTATNAGSSTRQGVQAAAWLALGDRLMAEVSGTWNHARMSGAYVDAHGDQHEDGSAGGAVPEGNVPVPGVADYHGALRLESAWGDQRTGVLTWRVVGPHVPIGEEGVTTQPYSVLDLAVSLPVSEGLLLDLQLENTLDIRYVELRSSGWVSPGQPRRLAARLRFGTP